ncbi:MAG: hypothetical protein Q9208_000735 [Pyrenodesmia sp. 3 TL-2023]
MSLLGKKFPAPIAGPMGPFYAAGVVIFYGVWKVQDALSNCTSYLPSQFPLHKSARVHGYPPRMKLGLRSNMDIKLIMSLFCY